MSRARRGKVTGETDRPMNRKALILLSAIAIALAGCEREPPARTLTEFMDDPLLLEAALVRCTQNRAETRFSAECVNAREAVKIIEAREEAKRRAELEAQSQRKRDALRRTQQAAAEARRRVAEAEKERREQEYFELYGVMPPEDDGADEAAGNVPMAVIPEATDDLQGNTEEYDGDEYFEPLPAAGSNAPVVDAPPADTPPADEPPAADDEAITDLDSIREELRRRNEDASGN